MIIEPWQMNFLGQLRITRSSGTVSNLGRAKWLLAYLALHPHCEHPREELIELFWPNSTAGQTSLRVSLCSLRSLLEPTAAENGSMLIATRRYVKLQQAAFATDAALFETSLSNVSKPQYAMQRAEWLAQAIQIYRGELLPGCYMDWALRERERLSQLYCGALHQLAAMQAQTGNLDKAIANALLAVTAEPMTEAYHLTLMRLYLEADRPQQTLSQFQILETRLREELNVSPSPEARALRSKADSLIVQLAAGVPAPVGPIPILANSVLLDTLATVTVDLTSVLPSSHLPVYLTPIVGRENELDQLVCLLQPSFSQVADNHILTDRSILTAPYLPADTSTRTSASDLTSDLPRLVTLLGPGGMGKTRLAISTAQRLRDAYQNSVWFVDLTGREDPNLIIETVRDVLGLDRAPSADPLAQLQSFLNARPALIVLDNFEQLMPEGSAIVRTLLEAVPSLHLLVTSRQRLNMEGEQEFAVMPLPVPQNNTSLDPSALLAYPGVALFVNRARSSRSEFKITPRNVEAVASLCTRLEGIPLALELAAARIGVMTPAEMLQKVEQRFAWLFSHRHDLPERHHTLYAVIFSMYSTLFPDLQRLFARLSVFRGGWTSDAAEAICDAPDTLSALQYLQEYSFILSEADGDTTRFRMYDTMREFASEEYTRQTATEQAALQQRYADYFLNMAVTSKTAMYGPEQNDFLKRLEADHDNISATLHWLIEGEQVKASQIMGASLDCFWQMRGYVGEGHTFMKRIFALSDISTPQRAAALLCAGKMSICQYQMEVAELILRECLLLAQTFEDENLIGWTLYTLGHLYLSQSKFAEARDNLEKSWECFTKIEEEAGLAAVLHKLGSLTQVQGLWSESSNYFNQSRQLFLKLGDARNAAMSLLNTGNLYARKFDYGSALECYEECLQCFQATGDIFLTAVVQICLGGIACRTGQFQEAELYLNRGLETCRLIGAAVHAAQTLRLLGYVQWHQVNFVRARRYYRESLTLLSKGESKWYIARLLFEFARLEASEGRPERSAWLLGAQAALLTNMQIGIDALEQMEEGEHEIFKTVVYNALGEDLFATYLASGEAADWKQAVAFALDAK